MLWQTAKSLKTENASSERMKRYLKLKLIGDNGGLNITRKIPKTSKQGGQIIFERRSRRRSRRRLYIVCSL